MKKYFHATKGIERVIEKIIRERVFINDMQFGFMPGRGSTDAIFILRQLQEEHLANRKFYFAFVDFEKAFNQVPRKVILESITPTLMNLELKLEFIRVQCLAFSYSSLYSKLCHVSSALAHPGSCCMLMI